LKRKDTCAPLACSRGSTPGSRRSAVASAKPDPTTAQPPSPRPSEAAGFSGLRTMAVNSSTGKSSQ
jgi:hypothetical protein